MMRVLLPIGEGRASPEAGERVDLDQSEIEHLRVRRARDNQRVELLNGAGLKGTGRLLHSGKSWAVEIESLEQVAPPADLTLAVAAGDRERFSWLVEKAVELGVTELLPLETIRTAGVATSLKAAHLDRLRRRALEATKQCGASWVLRLESPVALSSFLRVPRSGTKWLADEGAESPPFTIDQGPVTVVVGPEGGLTHEERDALIASGYHPVSLGPRTLRFETAALAAAVLVSIVRLRESHA